MATKYWISASNTSFDTAANWSGGSAPTNSDVLVFDYRGVANVVVNTNTVLTGLTVYVEKSYVGQIGALNTTTATYLTFETGTAYIGGTTGQGSPTGSPLCMINGNTSVTVHAYDSSSSSASSWYPPILLKSAALTLNQYGGSVGVAALTGETTTLTAGKVTKGSGSLAPSLYLGAGTTVTALTGSFGTILSRVNQTVTAATMGGTVVYEHQGTGAHTTLTGDGSSVIYYTSGGTVTTLNLASTFDRTRYTGALTITDRNFYEGYRYLINCPGVTTHTNALVHVRCSYQDGKIEAPAGVTV